MTIQEAIKKIQEKGFSTNVWSKNGRTRIYITFKWGTFENKVGFIGSDKTELKNDFSVMRSAEQKKKDFFAAKNIEISAFGQFKIEWTQTVQMQEKNLYATGMEMLKDIDLPLAEKERISMTGGWQLTHDL